MGLTGKYSGKQIRKACLALSRFAPVPYWLQLPVRDLALWMNDAIEWQKEIQPEGGGGSG